MANIGDLYYTFRGDGARLKADAKKEGEAAGDIGGKSFTARFKKAFSGSELKSGLLSGLGLAGGLGVANAVSAGLSSVVDQAFAAVDAASNLNEAMSKSEAVFKDSSDEMEAWAETASESFGQSKRQALEAAGTFGNLIQAFGIGADEAAEMSMAMVELASDLASFNNTSVDDALEAIRSGLSGETEPLKRFGVALNDVRLKEEALRLGLIKTTKGTLPIAIKTQAAYALILKDTALAQGDFERTSDGLANTQKTLQAQVEDLQAAIGEELLPIMLELAQFTRDDLVPALRDFIQVMKDAAPLLDALGDSLFSLGPSGTTAADAFYDASDAFAEMRERLGRLHRYMKDAAKDDDYITHTDQVGDALGELGEDADTTKQKLSTMAREAGEDFKTYRDRVIGLVREIVTDAYDVLDNRARLSAVNHELAELDKVIATGNATKEQKEEYRDLSEEQQLLLLDLRELGIQNTKEMNTAINQIRERLKTAVGQERKAMLATLALLVQLQIQAGKTLRALGFASNAPGFNTGANGPIPQAQGGPVYAGQAYTVGEVGRELFVPATDGYIVPHSEYESASSGMGGGITVQLIDQLPPVRSVRDIGSQLRDLEFTGYLGERR